MTAEQLKQFRICILQQLRAVGDGSLPVSTLVSGAKLAGFESANEENVRAVLVYLADKQLVMAVGQTLSPEVRRWRILAAGIDLLATEGL